MYLKSIEVQGFKSFANRLVFEFHQGITAIVGPNGSGKSNVADAVRWVLGEQSAKSLRSGNMQDVIFAGTETRKPMSFASVSITFDNSDHKLPVEYNEVTVSRRLYRSGESEYLLNKVPVRLKEIKDIFYDTGIGKEGYSIIGQGQVERILNGKPEERRELFDEAAGIVKFKKRKAETLKKLADEEQNLVRVNDILKELTSQIEPLKKQSSSARIYLDSREKLKNLDVNLFQIDAKRIERQLGEIKERSEIAEHDIALTKEKFEQTRSEYEQVEKDLDEIDATVTSLSEKSSKNAVLRQQLKGQIDLLREQISSLRKSREQYASRKDQITKDLVSKTEELRRTQSEYQSRKSESDAALEKEQTEEKRLEETDLRIAQLSDEIDQAKNDVISMLNGRAAVKGKIQRYDTMLEQLGIRQSEMNKRLLNLKEDESAAAKDSAKFESELKDLTEKKQKLEDEMRTEMRISGECQSELNETGRKQEKLQSGYHHDASRLDALKAMAERYEGYSLGIRKIMDQKNKNHGIRGVVADLIEVPASYEQAIEIALGGSVRNIVTDNENTAKYLIEYLKVNRYGRVTFLPLTSIRPREFNQHEILKEDGVIGIAADLVKTDPEFSALREYLLGRIVIVNTVDDAIRLGRKYHHSVYMVTLAGESFAPGGSITGGSFKNKDNLLGRKREIGELTGSVKALKKSLSDLEQVISKKRVELACHRDKITALNESIQELNLKSNTLKMSKKQSDEQLSLSRINWNSLEKEIGGIRNQIEDIKGKSKDIASSLTKSEEAEQDIQDRTEELNRQSEELQKKRKEQAEGLEKIRVNAAEIGQKITFLQESLTRLEHEKELLKTEDGSLSDSVSKGEKEEAEKTSQIEQIQKTIDEGILEAEKNEKLQKELSQKKQKLSESHRDFFDLRDRLSEQLGQLDKEVFRLNSQKERLMEARESSVSYLWDEYEMTPSEAKNMPLAEVEEDRQSLKRQINSLKDQIRKLGPVNVGAIEEYKSVEERYTFLSSQQEDLVKSEETLMGIVKELDTGMRKQFEEKFSAIQKEFDQAFSELFGGGHGSLVLDTEADILEADISIIAHPPGKKLQNMMQLSGGEKALTAIALLFAIQNLKPSPFCLLDEIEAALDDSNVSRYAQYLHKLTKNTQFIIITHRRGTMAAADRLYGITMQEKGVSTLVSVNLIEDSLSE